MRWKGIELKGDNKTRKKWIYVWENTNELIGLGIWVNIEDKGR